MTLDPNYDEALKAVYAAVDRYKGCTEEEREALKLDWEQLQSMAEKLESARVEIAVFGEISTGKSALINALLGQSKAKVNVRGGWTRDAWHLPWDGVGYCVPGFADSQVVLVDTPGLNEVAGEQRAEIARQTASRADLVLFVTDSDLNETEYSALLELAASHKPLILVLNKADLYSRDDLEEIVRLLKGPRLSGIVPPENVVVTTANPREMEYVIEAPDGTTRSEWRRPQPDIEPLREKILEVLTSEGDALIALNAVMYAADKSDRMAALRIRLRNDRATNVIWSYAVTKSMAVALNPSALLDVVGGSAVDMTMVVTLGRIYGMEITTNNARELVTSILKSAGWVMLGEMVVSYGSSLFKGLSGGTSTALTAIPQGAAAGYGSYIVGQAARYYFEHGASWGSDGPKRVITQILENTDKQSVLEHLKGEIRRKIGTNRHGKKGAKEG